MSAVGAIIVPPREKRERRPRTAGRRENASLASSERTQGALAATLERRLVVVSGKGGTGKSTAAAALALLAARSGRSTLLIFTDGRADAAPLLGAADPGYAETEAGERLHLLTTSFSGVLEDFVRSAVPISFVASQVLGSSTFRYFTRATPGLPDVLLLGKVRQLLQRKVNRAGAPRYDLVVLDAPATGHAISLLSLPRTLLKTVPGGPLRTLAQDLDLLLSDPKKSALVLVAEPSELAARETEEMAEGATEKSGISSTLLVVNRIGRGGRSEVLPRLHLPTLRVAEMEGPPDRIFLESFAAQLQGAPPPASRPGAGPLHGGSRAPKIPFALEEALETERLLVLVGPGGVGKTTLAAACGLAAARKGRQVLVMTVDPARRLVQALGLSGLADDPVEVTGRGIPPGGRLRAMQIDPAATFDRLLRRIASPEAAERIRANPLYSGLVDSLPGVTEYMGVEALAEHSKGPGVDLIVLDTPPAARGLDFLSAPRRMVDLLENDALRWFLRSDSLLNRALSGSARGAAAILRLADRALGFGFLTDLVEFFRVFDGLYDGFAGRSRATADELSHARFVVATSPDATALQVSAALARSLIDGGKRPSLLVNRCPLARPLPEFPQPLERLPELQLPESLVPAAEIPSDLAYRMVRSVTPASPGRSPAHR